MSQHRTARRQHTPLLRRTKVQSNLDQLDDLRKMCDTINDEIGRLAVCLNHRHGGTTAAGVTLAHVTTCPFTHYSETNRVDLMPLLAVQRRAVGVFMEREGVGGSTLDAALAGLSRANGTVPTWRRCRSEHGGAATWVVLRGGGQTVLLLLNS